MNQEIEDCFVSNYLNRFDVLILIALKRIGLHYTQRNKIIRHYRKINNERKLENDIQTFMFQYSKNNSYIDDSIARRCNNYNPLNIRKLFYRPQRLPFQQGMNNLVQIHRKYGHEVFNKMYGNYVNNLIKKYDSNIRIDLNHIDSSIGLYILVMFETTNKTLNDKNIGSFFNVNSFRVINNSIISQINRSGDIITNIDVPDPDRIIKSVQLSFNNLTYEKLKFTYNEKESLFNFDTVFAPCVLCYTNMDLIIKLKDNVTITGNIIDKLKANILYHQTPNSHRIKLCYNKYYMEITDCYGMNFYQNEGLMFFNVF